MRSLGKFNVYYVVIISFFLLISCTYLFVDFSPENMCVKQLPRALIIGAPKCGTAALSAFLSFHPNISIEKNKEINFFSTNFNLGFDWYKEKLPCSKSEQLVVERSSNYFITEAAIDRIWRMNKHTKLILIVCDPVRRAISQFAMSLERNKLKTPTTSFENFVYPDGKPRKRNGYIIKNSNYSLFFELWRRVFPMEQFHILNGDNLKTNPWEEVAAVEPFLGIKDHYRRNYFVYNKTKGFFCYKDDSMESLSCLTPSKGRKHPDVNERTKTRLAKFYRPYNELFFKQCNKTFSW